MAIIDYHFLACGEGVLGDLLGCSDEQLKKNEKSFCVLLLVYGFVGGAL